MIMLSVAVAGAGIAAHLLKFKNHEWHLHTSQILFSHLAVATCSVLWFWILEARDLSTAINVTLFKIAVYLTSLFGSMTIYRLFFHRLRHFPGPRMAAVTKLWHVYACRDSRNHLVLEDLRRKYGDFVRTGPEEVTIFRPCAIEKLDGAGNRNTRTDWYDLLHPMTSPVFTRDPASHMEKRRVWTQALSHRAILEYLPRILRQIAVLDEAVAAAGSAGVLLNDTMSFFAFDSMGEFAFNESFGMMKTNTWHKAVVQQRSALSLLGPFGCAVWIVRLGFSMRSVVGKVRDWMGMVAFCNERIEQRMKWGALEPDIAFSFIEDFHRQVLTQSLEERLNLLRGNAVSVIVGGSDTTGPSLILLWYALAKHPEHAEKIFAEISCIDETDPNLLATLPHLNGVINETMRLLPAALTGGNRVTPAEGMWIEDTFIPGNVKVHAPKFSIFRLESAFALPTEFIPERWTTRPDLIKDNRAFAPFGTGRRACVGKNLALTQIRLVAATLLKKYHVRFMPGQDNDMVEREMRDQVTAQPGPCRVIFEAR